jgi:phosphate transport system permease protein
VGTPGREPFVEDVPTVLVGMEENGQQCVGRRGLGHAFRAEEGLTNGGRRVTFSTADIGTPTSTERVPRVVVTQRTTADKWFRSVSQAAGVGVFVILGLIGIFLAIRAWPALSYMGVRFFTTPSWVPISQHGHAAHVGIAVAAVGTVIIALIALVIAVPVSISAALFISEYAPRTLFGVIPFKSTLTSVVDLMAAVPSIIYGLWGLIVLEPHIVGLSRWLSTYLGFLPFFKVASGTTLFTGSSFIAGVLVAIMILPIVTSISREIFSLTPLEEREGALALGASRARVIRDVVLPFSKSGLVGAIMLGLGRALGEAIAVTLIISLSFVQNFRVLSSGGNSIAALIANLFGSGGKLGLSGLLAAGLVLFLFTLAVNTVASVIVSRTQLRRR